MQFPIAALALLPLLCACQPTVYHLMPEPIADQRSDYDLTPPQERNGTIVLGYATNRKIDTDDPQRAYGKDFDLDLRFGKAFIQIGSGEESWQQILDMSLDRDRDEPVPLTLTGVYRTGYLPADASLQQLSPDIQRLVDDLNDYIDKSLVKEVTIYVHGANTSFYRGAALGAQYRHFSGRVAPVILYAWPSTESIVRYGRDVSNIDDSVPAFVRFLTLISQHTRAEKLNIIAYSAGAQLTTKAIAVIGSGTSGVDRELLRFGKLYYAAPDAEFNQFVRQMRSYLDLFDNVTITVNAQDSVLKMSQRFNKKSRLGRPDLDELDSDDLAWAKELSRGDRFDIIAMDSEVIPGFDPEAHDYWYNSPWVSSDVIMLLTSGYRPDQRGLESISRDGKAQIWHFPADYSQRIEQPLQQLRKQWFARAVEQQQHNQTP